MIGREYILPGLASKYHPKPRWRVVLRWAKPSHQTHVCGVCGDIRELPRSARGVWAAEHVHGRDLPLRDGVFTHRRLGDGPRNVLIEDVETGERVVRPFRGLRKPAVIE